MNNVVKSKRILWIDYAKVLGMYLVILGHTMLTPPIPYIKGIIYAFHMPLFFFISGFLHKSNINSKRFFLNCVKQLLIPFLFFNFLELIPKLFMNNDGIFMIIWNFLKEMATGIFLGDPPVGPSWFILCLLWMKILLWGCTTICKSQKSLLYSILFITIIVYFWSNTNYIHSMRILCISNALISFPFYAIAYIIKLNYEKIQHLFKQNEWIFLLITILFFIVQHYNTPISLQSCNIGKCFLLMLIAVFSGILICVKVCSFFKSENHFVYTLSAGSIIILCTHGFILNMTINKYIIGDEKYTILWYIYSIIGCIIIMTIEYPIIKFFFKYLNWTVGGRKL